MEEVQTTEVRGRVAEEEGRPDLSAESFSPRMRIGLLLITLFGIGLMTAMVIAAVALPNGMLDVNPFIGAYSGGILIGLGFFLMVIYGGLCGNNPRIDAGAKIVWFLLFASIGPIALPAYWFMHVWPAPYEPWTDPDRCVEPPHTMPSEGTPILR